MGGPEVLVDVLYKGGAYTLHESSKRPAKERDAVQ